MTIIGMKMLMIGMPITAMMNIVMVTPLMTMIIIVVGLA